MILLFPHLDALRFALVSGIVPVEVAMSPVRAGRDPDGRLSVESNRRFSKSILKEFHDLNIHLTDRHLGTATQSAESWLQLLPPVHDNALAGVGTQTPVLFEFKSALLPTIVGEILRLGNDRQSYRILNSETGSTALLRVVGPPYYTLLRAFEKEIESATPIRAYLERAPRIWIELGYTHELIGHLQTDDQQLLMIRSNAEWLRYPAAEFHDIYETLDFQLPNAGSNWKEGSIRDRLVVSLKLIPGQSIDAAELWIIQENGIEQLEELVRHADDRLLEQLRFAVGETPDGRRCVILAAATSRKSPPVIALDQAVGFKAYWRIPNLFLPVGTRLHPTLRRDVVSRLLANDRDHRVWLYPDGQGGFVPCSIKENAFRSLADWVEYVVDSNSQQLREWIGSSEFDFENFICTDHGPNPKSVKATSDTPIPTQATENDSPVRKPTKKPSNRKAPPELSSFTDAPKVSKAPNEWRIHCDQLEQQFRELEGPLDTPERTALWPQLAEANVRLGEDRRNEAAICWLNSLWGSPDLIVEYVNAWAMGESRFGPSEESEFETRIRIESPTPAQVRSTISMFLALSVRNPMPNWLRSRFPAIQSYLQEHDSKLAIRAVWLTSLQLARLTNGDALGLARVRDRLLDRLFERGLSAEQDLPSFLRFSGVKNSERARIVRERTIEIHRSARAWAEKSLRSKTTVTSTHDSSCTLAYLDLMFAYGLARLGETNQARQLCDSAKAQLTSPKAKPEQSIVANSIFKLFNFRIDSALAGRAEVTPFPQELQNEIDAIRKKGSKTINDPHTIAYYVISRMCEQSSILEPQEKSNPYAEWMKVDDLIQELATLARIHDPAVLSKKILNLYHQGTKGVSTNDTKLIVLQNSLRLAPRVGLDFTVELLGHLSRLMNTSVPNSYLVTMENRKLGRLFETSLFLAAHYDRPEILQELITGIFGCVIAKPDDQRYELVNYFAGRCLSGLRKVGLREEIDKLLQRFQDDILKGKSLEQLKTLYGTKPDVWADALQTMLNLAAGWMTFGLVDQAIPILETARQEIVSGSPISVQKYTNLCRAYVSALGQGPADFGMAKIEEFFTLIDPSRITNTFTSAPFYSRLHLNLIEDVVQSLVSDEFAQGQAGQRWLDEDEHLVRRRIHQDMRMMNQRVGVTSTSV